MKKALIAILILGSSIASAKVDYIAIGKMIAKGNADIQQGKAGFACVMKDYYIELNN